MLPARELCVIGGVGNGKRGRMTAVLSRDGGPAFGAHAFIWAGEGAELVVPDASANSDRDGVFRDPKDTGYGDVLALESFAATDEALIGATVLWRDAVGDPDALVRDCLAFLRAKRTEYGVLG